MQIVINDCYGGFGLSHAAVMRYAELKGITLYPWVGELTAKHAGTTDVDAVVAARSRCFIITYTTIPKDEYQRLHAIGDRRAPCTGRWKETDGMYFSDSDIARDDPLLAQVVEELGDDASGGCAKLKIIEIPDGVEFEIEEYDGIEWAAEAHRTWGR